MLYVKKMRKSQKIQHKQKEEQKTGIFDAVEAKGSQWRDRNK